MYFNRVCTILSSCRQSDTFRMMDPDGRSKSDTTVFHLCPDDFSAYKFKFVFITLVKYLSLLCVFLP